MLLKEHAKLTTVFFPLSSFVSDNYFYDQTLSQPTHPPRMLHLARNGTGQQRQKIRLTVSMTRVKLRSHFTPRRQRGRDVDATFKSKGKNLNSPPNRVSPTKQIKRWNKFSEKSQKIYGIPLYLRACFPGRIPFFFFQLLPNLRESATETQDWVCFGCLLRWLCSFPPLFAL